MRKKGWSLIELLVVMALLPVIMVVFTRVFRVMALDTPMTRRIMEQTVTLAHVLGRMQDDLDLAMDLPPSSGPGDSNDSVLLIDAGDHRVVYALAEGKVIRRFEPLGQASEVTTWSLPSAKVEWHVRRTEGRAYAVEVLTSVRTQVRGEFYQKMANAHVFFVGRLGGAGR